MPSPKSGSPGNLVPPADPDPPQDSITADPGSNSQSQSQSDSPSSSPGSSSSAPPPKKDPFKPDKSKKSWIEINLADPDGHPIPGEAYEVTLPDNTVAAGTLDDKGHARVEGFDPGSCKITFPNLDQSVWE